MTGRKARTWGLVSALASLLVVGCAASQEATRMWIGPEVVECEGVAPMMCLQVAYSEDDEYQLFYDQIAGFEPVEGTSYVIDVEITEVDNPPADASSLEYTLIEIVAES
jgi:hypothetical protein